MNDAIKQYRQLRSLAEKSSLELSQLHTDNIVCAAGCSNCCVNLSVFPVEFYSILETLKANNVKTLSFDDKLSCGFLKDSLCSIYNVRPLICMTHGLPIVFRNDESEEPEYSVSFCEKNFTNADLNTMEFNRDNTFNIDDLNAQLSQINYHFIQQNKENVFDLKERIELRRLLDFL